jgi:hypothetical protein
MLLFIEVKLVKMISRYICSLTDRESLLEENLGVQRGFLTRVGNYLLGNFYQFLL